LSEFTSPARLNQRGNFICHGRGGQGPARVPATPP